MRQGRLPARKACARRALRPEQVAGPDGTTAVVVVDDAESPLAWLRSRRDRDGTPLIGADEYAAGERFRADYTVAGLMARTTMNWDAFAAPLERGRSGGAGGGLLVTEAALAARGRIDAALRAVGPELGSVLVDVLCHLKGLGDVERLHGWPVRSGKVVLRVALAALARHYGLDAAAHGPRGGRTRGRTGAGAGPRP